MPTLSDTKKGMDKLSEEEILKALTRTKSDLVLIIVDVLCVFKICVSQERSIVGSRIPNFSCS